MTKLSLSIFGLLKKTPQKKPPESVPYTPLPDPSPAKTNTFRLSAQKSQEEKQDCLNKEALKSCGIL